VGCSSYNYLEVRCKDSPQVDILSRPKRGVCPERAKAIIYFETTAQENVSPAWKERLATIVYQALKQEGVFQDVRFGGPYTFPDLKELSRRGYEMIILLKGASLLAPTKTTPGHLFFSLRIILTKEAEELWSISSTRDLCPDYPKNYAIIYISRGRLPEGDVYAIEKALFEMAREVARSIKNYGCHTEEDMVQTP